MNEKMLILQNSVENVILDYVKTTGMSFFEVVACLDSISNTFRRMLLTKLAYNSVEKAEKEESDNVTDSDHK